MLFLSALIGIYYAYKDRRKSVTDYYYGGKKMSPVKNQQNFYYHSYKMRDKVVTKCIALFKVFFC